MKCNYSSPKCIANRFLIHNYIHQRQRAARYSKIDVQCQQKQVQKDLSQLHKEMTKMLARIDKVQNRDIVLRNIDEQLTRLEQNRVFHGKKSRQYKGLLDFENVEKQDV